MANHDVITDINSYHGIQTTFPTAGMPKPECKTCEQSSACVKLAPWIKLCEQSLTVDIDSKSE